MDYSMPASSGIVASYSVVPGKYRSCQATGWVQEASEDVSAFLMNVVCFISKTARRLLVYPRVPPRTAEPSCQNASPRAP